MMRFNSAYIPYLLFFILVALELITLILEWIFPIPYAPNFYVYYFLIIALGLVFFFLRFEKRKKTSTHFHLTQYLFSKSLIYWIYTL
jgi:hypothetical protein